MRWHSPDDETDINCRVGGENKEAMLPTAGDARVLCAFAACHGSGRIFGSNYRIS